MEIIEGLEKLRRKNELEKQRGKVMAYSRAIATLKTFGQEIKSVDQVKGLPGIGDGIMKKVKEYIDNGKFREVIDPFNQDKMKAL
jgi:DNA polymerase/3'-5' exonuclease PolX